MKTLYYSVLTLADYRRHRKTESFPVYRLPSTMSVGLIIEIKLRVFATLNVREDLLYSKVYAKTLRLGSTIARLKLKGIGCEIFRRGPRDLIRFTAFNLTSYSRRSFN